MSEHCGENHEHCGHSHEHHHEHRHGTERNGAEELRQEGLWDILKPLLPGVILYVCALLVRLGWGERLPGWGLLLLFLPAYLALGGEVLKEAAENLLHGELLDENFLMAIATVGALAIGSYSEAVGVMLFFRLGEAFEELASERSRRRIREALDLRPETVCRLKADGEEETVPAAEAQPGDLLLVRVGERVALDCTVVSGESFLDTSALTGEPVPRRAVPGDRLPAGYLNSGSVLTVRAEKPLAESAVSRILRSVEEAEAEKPRMTRFITRFARVYTPIVVALALLVAFGFPLVLRAPFKPYIYTAVSFLVMSCPCALVISIPLAYLCGIGRASSRGILFKSGAAVEALSRVKAVALDKTGTLTRGEFAVSAVEPAAESGLSENALLTLAAEAEQLSVHPIARSISSCARERGLAPERPEELRELPGKGIAARIRGKVLFAGSRSLLREQGVPLSELPETVPGATEVLLAEEGRYLGRLLISDRLKEDAAEAMMALKDRGLTLTLLTGDRAEAAAAAAMAAGLDEVQAELLPEGKIEALKRLRQEQGSVLYLGDGINDAPVLAGADVGAAMGSGADAAIESADMVFLTGRLRAVPEALRLADRTRLAARENVIFALTVKGLVLLLGLTGLYSSMWLAVFADTGVAVLCILNALRLLIGRKKETEDE